MGKKETPKPRSRLWRVLRRIGAGFALLVLAAGGWALFVTLYDPDVPLAEPIVVEREPGGREVTVVLGGDFAPTDQAVPFIEHNGWHYPYERTAEVMRQADVAFANLEAPVTGSTEPFWPWKDYLYRVDPAATEALQWVGLDVVSLANNHAIDYQERGLVDTLDNLDAAGIERVGAGRDESEARRPVIFDVGGTRIGFLAYLEHRAAFNLYLRTYAVGDRPGCAMLRPSDIEEDIRRLRPLVDVLIVSVHWGENYEGITPAQEEYARRLVDLGADVVAGHHPHIVQAVEVIRRSVVFYSLGNWAWGAIGHSDFTIGVLARLHIRPRRRGRLGLLTGVELVPIVVQNRIVDYQPRPITADEVGWLDGLREQSRARGTELELDGTILRVPLD